MSGLRGLAIASLCAALLPLAGVGCASSAARPTLSLTSAEGDHKFEQKFASAYAARTPEGSDVVLVCSDEVTPESAGAVAKTDRACSLRQIMHIRVLWAPDGPMKVGGPASTNATIHWYVFTDDARRPRMIEYSGTGLVLLDPSDDTIGIKVRNASLKPVSGEGRLNDPIGATRFEGKFVAANDPRKVGDLLSEVKATVASAAVRQAVSQNRPAAGVLP